MRQTIKLFLLILLASCAPRRDVPKTTITTAPKAMLKPRTTDGVFDQQLATSAHHIAENSALLLLPMSGNNAVLGKGILNACILACKDGDYKNIDFYIIDAADTSRDKFELYDKFKGKNLKAIIGPVFYQETKQYGTLFPNIPILTFSNNLKANNNHTIACGMSPQDEIQTLFSFAASEKIDSFVVILPEGEFGDQILSYIKEEAGRQGLEDDLDIVRYVHISKKDATKCAKTSGKKAVFVVEPILAEQKLESMYIFTLSSSALTDSNTWNNSIFAFADNETQTEFVEKYRILFGSRPTILDIIGYDITNAVSQSILNKESVFGKNYSGCLGKFSLEKKSGLKRRLSVFLLENHKRVRLTD